jgi:hypothetical protein
MGADKQIPKMNSYEEIAEFWDTHSLADYWDQTEPAEFEIDPRARQRYLVAVDPGVLKRVGQIAQSRGLATESLVNLFLEQRLREVESSGLAG